MTHPFQAHPFQTHLSEALAKLKEEGLYKRERELMSPLVLF